MLRRSLLLLALLAASAFETTDAKKAKAAKPVTKDSAGFSDEELEEAMEEVLHSPSPPTVNLTDTRRLGTYDELVPAAPPNPPRDMTPMEAAANRATGPKEGDAIEWHVNGSQVSRFEFHSELVYINKDRGPNAIKVYRTMHHDKSMRGLPSCAAVDGSYLSLDGTRGMRLSERRT